MKPKGNKDNAEPKGKENNTEPKGYDEQGKTQPAFIIV